MTLRHAPAPLQPRALYEVIADTLRDSILRHELAPGEPVNDLDVARRYGVSRTPVREAIKVLCHEGLLTAHVRKGTSVTDLSDDERTEAAELHALLRGHARQHPGGPLLAQLLSLVERRLRLAHGPAFDPDGVR